MRTIVTTAAAALALSLIGLSTPASADQYDHNYNQYQNQSHDGGEGHQGPNQGQPRQGQWNNRDRNFDFNRHEGNFDKWERGWGNDSYGDFRHHKALNYWRLVRRLEAQGYYSVRGLRQSQFGLGWRAFAYDYRGQPVMLRINPYTGRVINVRYV